MKYAEGPKLIAIDRTKNLLSTLGTKWIPGFNLTRLDYQELLNTALLKIILSQSMAHAEAFQGPRCQDRKTYFSQISIQIQTKKCIEMCFACYRYKYKRYIADTMLTISTCINNAPSV